MIFDILKALIIAYFVIGLIDIFLIWIFVLLPARDSIIQEFEDSEYLQEVFHGQLSLLVTGICLISFVEWPLVIQCVYDAIKKRRE